MIPVLLTLAAMPWLQGFEPVASDDHGSRDVERELAEWQPADDACVASAYGGLRVEADLAPASGSETVLASYTQGIAVLDADHHLIARAPGFTCRGSADELVAIAVGDAGIGTPVYVLAATTGGHAESFTWLTLYRAGDNGQLVPAFTGAVERHEGKRTATGTIVLFPGGLLYRPPGGAMTVWLYDKDSGRYIQQLALDGLA